MSVDRDGGLHPIQQVGTIAEQAAAWTSTTRPVASPEATSPDYASPDPSPANPSPPVSTSRSERRAFFSTALNRTMPYEVFLPPAYGSSLTTRYPVLYMLHGIGGNDQEWLSYGLFTEADRLMTSGQIAPFLIVLPEGEDGYWLDHASGGPRWGTYTAVDVVSEIDGHFRTLADRRYRGIGGNSMGGHGALQLAMNYPRVFGSAAAHSATLRGLAEAPAFFGDEAYFDAHDPVHQFQQHPEIGRQLRLWIDIGNQDTWRPEVEAFHRQLLQAELPHEWHEYPGIHYGDYWTAHVDDYLSFQSDVFISA
jgi:enterochelin esterase-like enzyme